MKTQGVGEERRTMRSVNGGYQAMTTAAAPNTAAIASDAGTPTAEAALREDPEIPGRPDPLLVPALVPLVPVLDPVFEPVFEPDVAVDEDGLAAEVALPVLPPVLPEPPLSEGFPTLVPSSLQPSSYSFNTVWASDRVTSPAEMRQLKHVAMALASADEQHPVAVVQPFRADSTASHWVHEESEPVNWRPRRVRGMARGDASTRDAEARIERTAKRIVMVTRWRRRWVVERASEGGKGTKPTGQRNSWG